MRIQSLPLRFISRLIATRQASICVAVRNPRVVALSPNSPYASSAPEVAHPPRFPLDCLRYLTLLGINGMAYLRSLRSPRSPRSPRSRRPSGRRLGWKFSGLQIHTFTPILPAVVLASANP